jgi:hypothetical protein
MKTKPIFGGSLLTEQVANSSKSPATFHRSVDGLLVLGSGINTHAVAGMCHAHCPKNRQMEHHARYGKPELYATRVQSFTQGAGQNGGGGQCSAARRTCLFSSTKGIMSMRSLHLRELMRGHWWTDTGPESPNPVDLIITPTVTHAKWIIPKPFSARQNPRGSQRKEEQSSGAPSAFANCPLPLYSQPLRPRSSPSHSTFLPFPRPRRHTNQPSSTRGNPRIPARVQQSCLFPLHAIHRLPCSAATILGARGNGVHVGLDGGRGGEGDGVEAEARRRGGRVRGRSVQVADAARARDLLVQAPRGAPPRPRWVVLVTLFIRLRCFGPATQQGRP